MDGGPGVGVAVQGERERRREREEERESVCVKEGERGTERGGWPASVWEEISVSESSAKRRFLGFIPSQKDPKKSQEIVA